MLMEEIENMHRIRFQISGFLNIYMNFFMDFTDGVQDFRVVGDPLVSHLLSIKNGKKYEVIGQNLYIT